MTMPKWSTPNRQAHLVKLFVKSQGFCMYGHNPCQGYWVNTSRTVCRYGTPCTHALPNLPCRYKHLADDGMPIRLCGMVKLNFQRWHCGYNAELSCYAPYNSHYELFIDEVIDYWKADCRAQTSLDWKAEVKVLHNPAERSFPLRGRFNNIAQDIWHDKQPVYYLECLGMSGVTMTPFARVKVSSSFTRLHVDLGNTLRQGVSKNARRKAIRYGKALPIEVDRKVNEIVREAVRDYLK